MGQDCTLSGFATRIHADWMSLNIYETPADLQRFTQHCRKVQQRNSLEDKGESLDADVVPEKPIEKEERLQQ